MKVCTISEKDSLYIIYHDNIPWKDDVQQYAGRMSLPIHEHGERQDHEF